ncbi:glycosyl transferase [bacterium]|nr:glycosyl transferase [bacterium]
MSLTQQPATPGVAIVIVNWNTGQLLAKCLESIQAANDHHLISAVLVVDNDSHDDSLAQAKAVATDPRIQFIAPGANLGFAGGNQAGVAVLADSDAHILLLNPDTEIHDGTLTGMLAALNDKQAGIVGAKLQNPDGTHQESVRRFPTLINFLFLWFKLRRLLPGARSWSRYMMREFDYSSTQVVDQVMGAAFLVRRQVWDQLGGLDDGFFVWFEEVDLCKRAKAAGWQTVYTPKPRVTHYGGVSFNQLVGINRTKPWIKSSLRYIRKHTPLAWPLFLLLAPFALALALPTSLIHRSQQRLSAT